MKSPIRTSVQHLLRYAVQALRNDSGNSLVEIALGIGLCFTIILGAAEFGKLAYASIEVSDAAHAAAAYGAESRTNAADLANLTTVAADDAPDVAGMTASASYFCICSDGSSSTCSVTDCSTSRIIEYVQVNTSATYDPKIYVPLLPHSYTVTGKAVMRVEQ